MNMMGDLKKKVGEYVLSKHLRHHKRILQSCNLLEAKSIGVLFNATHLVSFEIVKDLVKNLSAHSKQVVVLGYVDSKQMIDHYLYRKGFEFFTRNHLNWYKQPQCAAVDDFIKQEFDILINLNLEESYPVKYILSLSKAKFKVGKYSELQGNLDLMIDIEKEKVAMKELQLELAKDALTKKGHQTSYDQIADIKTDVELQLNFLINQLVHYLSLIKN